MATDAKCDQTKPPNVGAQLDLDALENCLTQSITQANLLQQILDDERAALAESDTVSLTDNATQKRQCVGKLEELDVARQTIDKENRLALAGDETSDAHYQGRKFSHLCRSWARFIEIMEQCNRLNASNGAVIRARQTQVKAAINLLRAGTSTPDTYDLQGKNADALGARSLAEA